jgi:uncharacterized membrane protein HdeD (DUF308 family)
MSESKFLLKETSLLMVIFGIIAAVVALIALINPAANPNYLVLGLVLLIIASALELIFGAFGFRKSDDAGRAGYFLTVGIIGMVFMLIIAIVDFTIWSLIGIVLPFLYIIGGAMLRRKVD